MTPRDPAIAVANRVRAITEELNVALAMAARLGLEVQLFSEVKPLVSGADLVTPLGAADAGGEEYTGPTFTAYEFELRLKI